MKDRIRYIIASIFYMSIVACNEKDVSSIHPSSSISESESSLVVPKNETKLMPSLGLVYYNNEPFTGITEVHQQNGVLVESTSYMKGRRHGYNRKWFDNGNISFESYYLNGKQHGKSTSWWKNGHLRSEGSFEYGIANGLQEQWYQSGAKFKEINLKDGKEEGMQKSWRENGKIYNNYEAKDGRIFGLKRASLCFQLDNEEVQINK